MSGLLLFGTRCCHLCEEAERLVAAAATGSFCWRTIDIADEIDLLQTYGTRIPVLRHEDSGAELNWPFGATDLQTFLNMHSS